MKRRPTHAPVPRGFPPGDRPAAEARARWLSLVEDVGSDPTTEESAVLSCGREFLPPSALVVLDGGAPTADYYAFLYQQTEIAQREHAEEYARGHAWHQQGDRS